MRIKLCLFLIFLHASILWGQSNLDQKIKVEFKELSITEALLQLKEQTGIDISYSANFFDETELINLRKADISINAVLKELLKNSTIEFKLLGERIVLYIPKQITIAGYIEDENTGERLIGATIYDPDKKTGVVSNEYGFYSLTVSSVTKAIQASYVGYRKMEIEVTSLKKSNINFSLKSNSQLSEVVVKANQNDDVFFNEDINKTIEISAGFVKASPSLGGGDDYLRTAQLLPGIDAGVDGFGGLQVRGGDGGHNLMMLDGVTVYIPYHLLGAYSIYNPQTVHSAKILKSNFPARYGGRLSSVLDIRTRDGNLYDWKSQVSTSLVNVNGVIEGPLKKGKGSILLAGRYSPTGQLFSSFFKRAYFQDEDTDLSSSFYDFNVKLNYTLGNRDKIFLSVFNGADQFLNLKEGLDEEEEEHIFSELEFDWNNTIGALRWNHLVNEKLFLNTTFTYSEYGYRLLSLSEIEALDEDEEDELYFFSNATRNQDVGVKMDFDYLPGNQHRFRFGGGFSVRQFRPEISYFEADDIDIQDLDSIDRNVLDELVEADTFRVNEAYIYVEDQIRFNQKWQANFGLRLSSFNNEEELFIKPEPRFLLNFQQSEKSNWHISATRMVQYLHLISNSALRLPNDLWLPSSDELLPQTSWQFELGQDWNFRPNWSLSINGYFKNMKNLYTYPDNQNYLEDINDNPTDSFLVRGNGKVYGIETLLKYTYKGYGGIASYTLAKSERQFDQHNKGLAYASDFDQRHRIKIFLFKNFKDFQFGINWVFLSPNPQVSILALEDGENVNRVALNSIGDRNELRSKPYHRLDFSVAYQLSTTKLDHRFKLGIYNLYNRSNVAYYQSDFNDDENRVESTNPISSIRLIPSFSYSLRF